MGKPQQEVADPEADLARLASFYTEMGRYSSAETLYLSRLQAQETAFGPNDPRLTTVLLNLALLYRTQGSPRRAEPLLLRRLALQESSLGKEHPEVATTLDVLAGIYRDQGLLERVRPLAERSLAIHKAALNKDPADFGQLNALANIYYKLGDHAQAEPLYERVLSMREAVLGNNHPDLCPLLEQLANLYQAGKRYERARDLYKRSLTISETAFGKDSLHNVSPLHQLANLYVGQRLYSQAERLYQRALVIREMAASPSTHDVLQSLRCLARLYAAQGFDDEESLYIYKRLLAAYEESLHEQIIIFSDECLSDTLDTLLEDEILLYKLFEAHPENTRLRRIAFSAVLLRQGRSLQDLANTSRILYRDLKMDRSSLDSMLGFDGFSQLNEDTRTRLRRLKEVRAGLAMLSMAGPGTLSPSEYQQWLNELAHESEALERHISQCLASLRPIHGQTPPEELISRIATALPQDGALVQFVALPLTFERKPQVSYAAFLLFPNGRTHAEVLGNAERVESAVLGLYQALAIKSPSYQPAAQRLYEQVFRPLEPHLRKVKRLFLAPDGQLHLIPFAALHDGTRFIDDVWDFAYLTSGKDLLPSPPDTPAANSVVVIADPQFRPSSPGTFSSAPAERAPAEDLPSLERIHSLLRAELADVSWPPLPGTRREAKAIQRLLPQAQLLLGTAATKQNLLHIGTPGVLHIATHGFFLGQTSPSAETRTVGLCCAPTAPSQVPSHPLLRSGLVLAGTQGLMAGGGSYSRGSPLVTAFELAGLNLWGTQLVVLSACETGRGDVKLGQGVYGLRRALLAAGAETVVASLWQVDDQATSELMERYYQGLVAGQGRAAALRDAMRELRRKRPHPSFWAPFIAIGKDSPLQGLPLQVKAHSSQTAERRLPTPSGVPSSSGGRRPGPMGTYRTAPSLP